MPNISDFSFPWFDAHLDLAYLAGRGRDMHAAPEVATTPNPPAAITLPSLRAGRVRWLLGTIYTQPDGKHQEGYPAGDKEAAHKAGVAQLDWYRRELDRKSFCDITAADPEDPQAPIGLGLLMENADPIRKPEELAWWAGRGVITISLTWVNPSRYAMGNGGTGGITTAGRELLHAMREAGVVLDLSHLSQQSVDEVLEFDTGSIIATHSNCRALLGGEANEKWQRHLGDETICEIGRRCGIIGLNLYAPFIHIKPNLYERLKSKISAEGSRPTIEQALAHVEHICQLQGHRRGVGLGSDMDGGFSALEMCAGIEKPADLGKLLEGLAEHGWSDDELTGFASRNWLNFFSNHQKRSTA